ncbi:MgtC/SapB family protein [Bacillus sp. DNRA2]|uniref:MgtC/SapB family protein n=1 Tax=Bacillus sp. DNRA2 TaxID=2723053 RepID=UPI00145EB8E9|nr:MgtC/SapB family protein [Bacillus sp. DNRA2]NMD72823.1 MgtC/SapB family protein [Bacillus sp. DNRA2]
MFGIDLDLHILLKLGISAILGLIIGLERELKRKPVGLKTSLVICIVSCLLTIVSIESAYMFPGDNDVNITMDPLRLAAQIVSGIGFLGAGVILRRGNESISGLTTAAMIWGAAGIGIAVGTGFYLEAIFGVILLIFSVEIVPYFMSFLGIRRLREKEVQLKLHVKDRNKMGEIIELIKREEIKIKTMRIKDTSEGDHFIQLMLIVDFSEDTTEVYQHVVKIEGVEKLEVESMS